MVKARRLLVLFAVLAFGLVAALPSNASAAVTYYNCVLKPVGQWCDGRANGSYDGQNSWDYNESAYPGPWDGTVTACQRVFRPATGNWLTGDSCSANWTAHYYGSVSCVCYDAEARQYSGGPHSINGFANSAL